MLEWRNWQTHGTQNHPYKLSCRPKPPFFSPIAIPLTPLVYLRKPYTVWPFFEARPLCRRNTRSSAAKSTSTGATTAVLWQCSTYLAGKNRRVSTKEDGLAKAKDFAEDWYLGLRGKVRNGEITSGKTFREAAVQFERSTAFIATRKR